MTQDFRAACLEVFRQVRIEAPDTVRFGEAELRFPADRLLSHLQQEIYKSFFCGMMPNKTPEPQAFLIRALSTANLAGSGLQPKESLTDQPGAYLAFGRKPPPETKWLRLYWNVMPRGAVVLMAHATARLNSMSVPFQLKVLLDTRVRRRDAAVLYLPAESWLTGRTIVRLVCEQLDGTGDIHKDTPLFAKKLRPGVALAEDPQTGLSFGMHRAWLVACALARGYRQGHTTIDLGYSGLAAEFARQGLSIEQPYLNAGSKDVYC